MRNSHATCYLLILGTALAMVVGSVGSPYLHLLHLQHAPTVAILVMLVVTTWQGWLGTVSTLSICAFLWLHILGARWIYSFVPYDDWALAMTGTSLSDVWGWQRNHYDRLVHFSSGILLVAPSSEVLQRYSGMKPASAAVQAVAVVLAMGALYEIGEWQLAVTLSPQNAETYNGQQGDVWDPQADMALAGLGALISAGLLRSWKPTHHAIHATQQH